MSKTHEKMVPDVSRDVVACIAFAADPKLGSEAGAGASLLEAAAFYADMHEMDLVVFTRSKHVSALVGLLPSSNRCNVSVQGVDGWTVKQLGQSMGFRLESIVWQARVWRRLAHLMREFDVKVVHHITLASDAIPGAVHFLRSDGATTVWGPVGSSSVNLNTKGSVLWRSLRILKSVWFSILASRVSVVVCQTDWTKKQYLFRSKALEVEQNCSVDENILSSSRADDLDLDRGDRVVLVIGELIDRKRPWLGCEAARFLPSKMKIVFVGDGPLRMGLEARYADLIESGKVSFVGRKSRSEVMDMLNKSAGLLHTASREGAGWVVAEALACEKWVVTVEGSGADTLVARVSRGGRVISDRTATDANALARVLISMIEKGVMPAYEGQWSPVRFRDSVSKWYSSGPAR
ncbi:MAG: glycosyltransferase family 1 protein [Rhodococcus sp. (in: high G+C Gram-positive bacteria)]|nr:MAG: glycosyltransferase family 1 protein [Rhodococcus sp. (in: high G+C Gram-positive bacteria)]